MATQTPTTNGHSNGKAHKATAHKATAKKATAKKAKSESKAIDPKAAKALAAIPKRNDDGLSDEQAKAILAAHAAGATATAICERTGYAPGMIGYVLYRRSKEMKARAATAKKAEAKAKK